MLSIALVAMGPLSAAANAQSYREEAAISPLYVFQLMADDADEGNIQKISALSGQISEIISNIDTNFGVDIKSQLDKAVNSSSPAEVKRAIQTLILYDIKDVFRATEEGINKGLSLSKLKNRLKFAYNDYLTVSKWAKKADFALDRKIRKNFNEMITGLIARAADEGNASSLKSAMQDIEVDYRSIFGI